MAIKYKDFEKREQLRKDYIDKAAEAAKTQANAYTDEQIRNIPAPPAPDIPTSLPQKYEAFKVQLVQGNISEGEDPMWSEYHETLWNGSEVLTNSSATTKAHFVTDTVLYWRSPRKYNLLITINGTEKEFVFEGEHSQYGTNWVIWQLKENDVVVAEAECIGAGNGQYYNSTSTVFVYCPDGSPYIGQTMTAARYGKKQYLYSLTNPAAILQYPSETENTRFLTMCKSIATKNAKLKLTLTDNVIEANYANISNELVTTDYVNGDVRARWIGIVADRKPLAVGTYTYEDMQTCIKGILEVEYTDEEATKECVYDKIQGESYTFKIGDFNHDESSAFDYYFNGSILIPFDTAQIQASFTYRPVSGTEKSVQVKSMVNNGQMLPYFDISELFGQAANTVMAIITSNTAVENVDMGGRPITTISLTSNVQNFTDANDEIMVGSILTLTPSSLPQKYYRLNTSLTKARWKTTETFDWINGKEADTITTNVASWRFPKASKGAEYSIKLSDGTTGLYTVTGQNQQFSISINVSKTPTDAQTAITVRLEVNADGSARILCSGANKEYHYIYTTIIVNNTNFYELENSAIKVNSEVRYILDENSYAIAKSAGLRKLIDRTEGKLRFTAELPPTKSIGSYLVVGETSAEGLAYIDDVLYTIPSSLPQTYKKKAVTLATSGWVTASEKVAEVTSTTYSTYVNGDYSRFVNDIYTDKTKWTLQAQGVTVVANSAVISNNKLVVGFQNVGTSQRRYAYTFSNINLEVYNDSGYGVSSIFWGGIYNYPLTDADVKVNSEVRFTLDEANGKLAGQFGLKKTIDKEAGKLTFTADTLPTSAISGTLEIGETSTEGAAFVEGISEPSSVPATVAKTDVENTFTKTQTFNGTESQAGIKTNAIDNENGERVVYFNGTKQMFGSNAIPTQVRTSEQRLKLERPVSGGTGTEIVEVANLADLGTGGVIRKEVSLNWEAYDGEIDFSFTDLTKNYVTNSRFVEFWLDDNFTRLRLDIGKTYSISYNGTKYSAVATAATVGSYSTTKLQFTIGDKTLVILDQASASANISDENKPTHYNRSAIAYFSDYSTPSEATTITLTTCPAAYKVVIPYDDSFTNSADVTIQSPYPSSSNLYTPLFLAPSVTRGTDGYILYIPVVNTVTYSTDFVITPHSDYICPPKVLLTLNRSSGSVVRLSGFSNTYRRRLTLGYIINNTYWQQSGNKYIYTDTPSFTVNRFVNIELNFDNSTSLDAFTDAEVTIKKSCAWLPEKPTIMANSTPVSNIKVEVYGRVSY